MPFVCSCSSVSTHKATTNDITLNTEIDMSSLGIKYVIMPKCDIDDLQLTTVFYDSKGTQLSSITRTIGNVKEGVQCSMSVSIVDFGSDVLKVDYSKTKVSGGTAYDTTTSSSNTTTSSSGTQQPDAVIGGTLSDDNLGIILTCSIVIAGLFIIVIAFFVNSK